MLEFNLNSTESVSFVLDIAGESAPPQAKLVVPVSENYSMCFNAIIEENKATVVIPPLSGVIEGGTKEGARLEVIVPHMDEENSSSFFVPWSGDILFKAPVSVKAVVETKRPEVTATIKSAVVNEEIKKPEEDEKQDIVIKMDEDNKKVKEPGEIKPMFEFTGFQSEFLRKRFNKDDDSKHTTTENSENIDPKKKNLKKMMKQL